MIGGKVVLTPRRIRIRDDQSDGGAGFMGKARNLTTAVFSKGGCAADSGQRGTYCCLKKRELFAVKASNTGSVLLLDVPVREVLVRQVLIACERTPVHEHKSRAEARNRKAELTENGAPLVHSKRCTVEVGPAAVASLVLSDISVFLRVRRFVELPQAKLNYICICCELWQVLMRFAARNEQTIERGICRATSLRRRNLRSGCPEQSQQGSSESETVQTIA